MPKVINDLLSIDKLEHQGDSIQAAISINKNNEILKGHFPGRPVVPGACMLQIVKEVLERALNNPFRLKKADHLKFISMIDPANTGSVELDLAYKYIDEGSINVTAKLINGENICFKFVGAFVQE